jgi:hypothetical protein
MDEQRLGAVDFLDVGFGHTRLQVQNSVGIQAEDIANAWKESARRMHVVSSLRLDVRSISSSWAHVSMVCSACR